MLFRVLLKIWTIQTKFDKVQKENIYVATEARTVVVTPQGAYTTGLQWTPALESTGVHSMPRPTGVEWI